MDFTLNGLTCTAQAGDTVLQAARRAGVDVPTLCASDGLTPAGNCRACVVEVAGERTLAASCCRAVVAGMVVDTRSPRAQRSQRMVIEMLLAELPASGFSRNADHGELSFWADALGVQARPALQALRRPPVASDASHPAIAVNLDACIQCTRCVRACREVQVNDVIGLQGRGNAVQIVFDLADPLGQSSCVACGECVQACPTGALMPAKAVPVDAEVTEVPSVCPYCGVGCQLTYQVVGGEIVEVRGRNGPANEGRLCVKGRYGFDHIHHPDRLTQPLIRKPGVPKIVQDQGTPWQDTFRVATWDEALDLAASQLKQLKGQHGGVANGHRALAGFGSAKGSNEEAYLFQKLVRTAFGSNNVDHCTRLCHASSVAALLEGVGSAAVSNPVKDVLAAEVILVIGANPASNHPVAASFIKNAVQRGAKLIMADPRQSDLSRHAWRNLNFHPDTDVLVLNAMIHVILAERFKGENIDLAKEFKHFNATDLIAIQAATKSFSPEAVAVQCGLSAALIVECALAFAHAKNAIILWGMGISQHVHGTDNARALIALSAVAGQIGKPGSGLHPLRGQNNVQGASDAGLVPMMLPNYQRVSDPAARERIERLWGTGLDAQSGLTVVEILNKALADDGDPQKIRGLYVMGENPAMSDPDLNHARHALASLEHLVVQDIFLTETAWLADVVLPASAWPEKVGTVTNTDRTVQMGRKAVAPPGNARPDLWIIQALAKRLGLHWRYAIEGGDDGAAAVFAELRASMQDGHGHNPFDGITWERLMREGAVTYPCASEGEPGEAVLFTLGFPTPSGKARLVPTAFTPAAEQTCADYPLVLITGRVLAHWHTGSMTRRSSVLDALEPQPFVCMHPQDATALGLTDGQMATVESRRGQLQAPVQLDPKNPSGSVFMTFAFAESPANVLTNPALDAFGKIPEFKYCAVRVRG